MLKILLWIVSKDTRHVKSAINILERQYNGVKIIGKAAGEDISSIDKDFDVILVAGAKKIGMNKVTQAAHQLNLPEEKLLGDWIACIPGFTLEKYRKLQISRLSIFSMDCFGTLLSHTLGLPFRSPFVNLRMERTDFLTFLLNPRDYLEKELVFKEKFFHPKFNHYYPIYSLGDIAVRMVHYTNFEESVKKWEERKPKINWYNLSVITIAENNKELEQFDALPYGKKVCFVPFKSNLNSAWFIITKNVPLWMAVNRFGFGNPFFYDPFDMLLYGKKTPLIDM